MPSDGYVVSADAKKEDGGRRKATCEKGIIGRRATELPELVMREDPGTCFIRDAVEIGDEGTRALEGVEITSDVLAERTRQARGLEKPRQVPWLPSDRG